MSQLTVPWREPIVDQSGSLSPSWLIFYNELINRVGGTGNVTDLSSVIAMLNAAQAQIDYQSVQPQDAGAQEALRRIAELETQIPAAPNLSSIRVKLDELEALILDLPRPVPAPVLEQWNAPTLINSWVNWGGAFNPAGYWKDPSGVVHLRGLIKSGTLVTAAFVLPVGYRPANQELLYAISNNGIGRVDVDNAGNVIIGTGPTGSNAYFSLDGMTFRAA